jgi:hypothetical protein
MEIRWPVTQALLVMACTAPPHKFVILVDSEPKSATLTLNGETTDMMRQGNTFFGSSPKSDASGKIVISFKDKNSVECRIGYITNGEFEPHHFTIIGKECHGF